MPKEVKFSNKNVLSFTNDQESHLIMRVFVVLVVIMEMKKNNEINYEKRKIELEKLLDKYRKNDGSYDIIVPCALKIHLHKFHKLKYEWGISIDANFLSSFV